MPSSTTQPQASLAARLVDSLGNPLPGIRAKLRRVSELPAITSDSDGLVHFDFPWPVPNLRPQDSLYLDLAGPSVATRWVRVDVPRPEALHLGDVVLQPGGEVEGRALDPRGRPIAGVNVYFGALPRETRFDQRQARAHGTVTLGGSAVTDADGNYHARGVPARMLCAFGRSTQSLYAFTSAFAVHRGSTVRAPDLIIAAATSQERLEGRVLDPNALPLEGARMTLVDPQGEPLSKPAFTDAQGRFFLLAPWDSGRVLEASHADHGEARFEDLPTDQMLELRFPKSRLMEIVARGRDGALIPRLQVRSGPAGALGLAAQGQSLGPGRARLRVPDTDFSVIADAQGWQSATLGPFKKGHAPKRVEVILDAAGGISGRVLLDGEALQGASIHLHRPLEDSQRRLLNCGLETRLVPSLIGATSTDASGLFFLENDATGHFELHVSCNAQGPAFRAPLQLQSEERIALGDLSLTGSGRIAGRLLSRGDLAGEWIVASQGDGHVVSRRTDGQGRFHFDAMPAGIWLLQHAPSLNQGRLLRPESLAHSSRKNHRRPTIVDLAAGEVATCTIDERGESEDKSAGALQGELLLGNGPSCFRQAIVRQGDRYVASTLDSGGRFEVRLEASGPALVELSGYPAQGVRALLLAEIELGPQPVHWSLTPPTGTLSITGLRDPHSTEEKSGFLRPRYGLYRLPTESDGNYALRIEIADTAQDRIDLSDLPCGIYVLRSRSENPAHATWQGPEITRIELGAGDQVLIGV